MSNFDHLPDDATRLTAASLRSHMTGVSRHPTLLGWLGRYTLLVLLVGACAIMGGLLGPVIYALLN